MSRIEVMKTFEMLAKGQGYYGRLVKSLNETDENDKNEFLDIFKDCKDSVEVVMKVEC